MALLNTIRLFKYIPGGCRCRDCRNWSTGSHFDVLAFLVVVGLAVCTATQTDTDEHHDATTSQEVARDIGDDYEDHQDAEADTDNDSILQDDSEIQRRCRSGFRYYTRKSV